MWTAQAYSNSLLPIFLVTRSLPIKTAQRPGNAAAIVAIVNDPTARQKDLSGRKDLSDPRKAVVVATAATTNLSNVQAANMTK